MSLYECKDWPGPIRAVKAPQWEGPLRRRQPENPPEAVCAALQGGPIKVAVAGQQQAPFRIAAGIIDSEDCQCRQGTRPTDTKDAPVVPSRPEKTTTGGCRPVEIPI